MVLTIVLLIASFLFASVIVKAGRSLFMRFIGANMMFFDRMSQLMIILFVTAIVFYFIHKII